MNGFRDAYLVPPPPPPADFAGADDIFTNLAKEREPGGIGRIPNHWVLLVNIRTLRRVWYMTYLTAFRSPCESKRDWTNWGRTYWWDYYIVGPEGLSMQKVWQGILLLQPAEAPLAGPHRCASFRMPRLFSPLHTGRGFKTPHATP